MNQHVSSAQSSPTYYVKNAASHYTIRNIISSIIWVGLNIALSTYFMNEWGIGRAIWLTLILAIPAVISLVAIFRLRKRYTTDGGLAIGVTPNGLTLPGRGTIAWDNIVGVRQGGTGIVTGNIRLFIFEAFIGTRETYSIQVFVNSGVEELTNLSKTNPTLAASFGLGATRSEPHKGMRISTAYIQGLGQRTYDETLKTVLTAAAEHGIPTKF